MKRIHLVAVGKAGEIGLEGNLLWKLPPDLQKFKRDTMGQSLLVGRKTADSLPTLKGRILTVATREKGLGEAIREAQEQAKKLGEEKIFIIGGGEIYDQTIDLVDEVWMTKVMVDFPEADTHYPIDKLTQNFVSQVITMPAYHEGIPYQFLVWKRKK